MKYEHLCWIVTQRAGVSRARSDAVVKAVLQALAEQDRDDVLDGLLERLPREVATSVQTRRHARSGDLTEFLQRVATLAGIPARETRRAVRAVFAALQAAGEDVTLHRLLAPLGADYTALVTPPSELQDQHSFLETICDRAGIATTEQAAGVTAATLAALAERVTAGQATDLAGYLPAPLQPSLQSATRHAQPFDYSVFLARVAGQRATAETYATAVLTTLREATPEQEVQDTIAQLPDDLANLFTSKPTNTASTHQHP